ncbi:MAG: SDR family NAD(P)-dependent oxidoreductase [Alphaproteobacteria bacterium]|nr:SDR family NAD(P)-dependent oxidoreductase [Alphaproteobacteria bacterium]
MSDKPLSGRNAIITGASQGLGAEIARHYVRTGASVMLCARTAQDLAAMHERLAPFCSGTQRVLTMAADVADTKAVDRLVADTLAQLGSIDILVNNAGVYGPMGRLEELDWQAWADAVSINLIGTVYPCRAVLPHMRSNKRGKIVNLSGGGATNPLPRITSYAATKAAVVRFTESLALEVKADGIDVNAIAPGALATRLLDEVLAAGPAAVGEAFHKKMIETKAKGGTPLNVGAELAVFLGSAASDGVTGKLISAVWDPWRKFDDHKKDLEETDIYTLRRIVPADRGKDWG